MSKFEHFLTMDNLNPAIKSIDFSKNEVVKRAKEIEKELLTNDLSEKKPFENLTYLNIDDFQSVGQKPITYFRQVMTLCTYPSLISSDNFPQDVKDKAKKLLSSCLGGSTGAYPEGAGIDQVREDIAEFISKRDEGVETNPDEVFMSHGASGGIKTMIKMLSNHWSDGEKPAGFMIPVPCYPLFLSAITELNSQAIYYHLNENANWRIDIDELERAYNESLSRCKPRSICIINPGNPTGHVLTVEKIREIIRWAYEKRLYILADEVHQDTVYTSQGFHSFRKVAHLLGPPYSKMEMASFYSTSKGFMAECGSLSGYYEVANIDKDVRFELKKLTSAIHTSAVGQILMSAIVDGPKLGDPSYELFIKEKTFILNNLKENARFVPCFLNEIDGIVCNPVQGAIYAFPRLKLPQKAVEHAKSVNLKADVYYCLELLNRTGICVLPGSTFEPAKKVDDEETLIYHFRVSLSYGNDQMRSILEKIKRFHIGFFKTMGLNFSKLEHFN